MRVTSELGVKVRGDDFDWAVLQRSVIIEGYRKGDGDGDGHIKPALGRPSPQNNKIDTKVWIGRRILHRQNDNTQTPQLLIVIHQPIRLHPQSAQRDIYIIVPVEGLRIGNEDSTFSPILDKPSATNAVDDTFRLRIQFRLGGGQKSEAIMPPFPYPHGADGAALHLLLELKYLSEASQFNIIMDTNIHERKELSEIRQFLENTGYATPGIDKEAMYDNHGCRTNDWTSQGVDNGPPRPRKRRRRQSGNNLAEKALAQQDHDQEEVIHTDQQIAVPEDVLARSVNNQKKSKGLSQTTSVPEDAPPPQYDSPPTEMLAATPCDRDFLFDDVNLVPETPVKSPSPRTLTKLPDITSIMSVYLQTHLTLSNYVHYDHILDLLNVDSAWVEVCTTQSKRSMEGLKEAISIFHAAVLYKGAKAVSQREPRTLTREAMLSETSPTSKIVAIFKHEFTALAIWMDVLRPHLALKMSQHLIKAASCAAIDDCRTKEEYGELARELTKQKAHCIAEAIVQHGHEVRLYKREELQQKMLRAKIRAIEQRYELDRMYGCE